jgi:hypothetical protein
VDPVLATNAVLDERSAREARRSGQLVADDKDEVETGPLRARYEALAEGGGTDASQVARYLGWTVKKGDKRAPDRGRVLDTLGISRERHTMPYETACQLALAMDIDPMELGL